jgi:hypothetical protein
MSNDKQTAVEWLEKNMWEHIEYKPTLEIQRIRKKIQQAKEMEKKQIVKAFDDGDYNYHYSRKTGNDFENGEEYFEELYGGNK